MFPEKVSLVGRQCAAARRHRSSLTPASEQIFPVKISLVEVSVPLSKMPAPLDVAELPEMVSLLSPRVPEFRMAPPKADLPFSRVKPVILAVTPDETKKMRVDVLPLMARAGGTPRTRDRDDSWKIVKWAATSAQWR